VVKLQKGRVLRVLAARPGFTELAVEVAGAEARAVNYDRLTGPVGPGDVVLLNTSAVALGLGSGGVHFVLAVLNGQERELEGPGHIMKMRYTPLQVRVLSVEEADSPHHEVMRAADSLGGAVVLVATLHSMLAPLCVALKAEEDCRVVFVMTDGAALPLAFSATVPALRERGLLDGTVTCGHAFGGDLEAVNVYSGLLAARHVLTADYVVVAMGPGIVGTGTPWGFTGVEQGEILNATAVLGGVPLAVPRVSFADPRERHQGISHHTLTALGRVCLVSCHLPLPRLAGARMERLWEQVRRHGLETRHRVSVEDGSGIGERLAQWGLKVTTMGRGPGEDPEFFEACAAAAVVARRCRRSE
jgi:hypothetical protein